jgi:hypothetical protein
MNGRVQLTDELLVRALRQRMEHAPSPDLLDRVTTGAASVAQDRQPTRGLNRPRWLGLPGRRARVVPALGVAATALAVIVLVTALVPPVPPGASPTPRVSPTPTALPKATAEARLLGEFAAQRLSLGSNIAPIDVTFAFGSIWTANIRAGDVRRFDPATMAELARIPVDGAAWFAEADGALWVTNQTGTGLTRLDPETNTAVAQVGDVPPCGAPVVALGDIFQSACDANMFLRIDPETDSVAGTIPASGHEFLVLVGDDLITSGSQGLARLDRASGEITAVPGSPGGGGQLLGSDGETVWVRRGNGVERIDPADGRLVATLPFPDAVAVSFVDGRAWLSVPLVGVVEINLATNLPLRTVPLTPADIPREINGVLWVTDFNNSALWRIEL